MTKPWFEDDLEGFRFEDVAENGREVDATPRPHYLEFGDEISEDGVHLKFAQRFADALASARSEQHQLVAQRVIHLVV